MEIALNNNISIEQIQSLLEQALPDYKINQPAFAANKLLIKKGTIVATITLKEDKVNIAASINFQNFGVALGLGIGVVCGFIGALVFILIFSAAKSNDFKELKEEIAGIITQKFGKTTV